MTQPVKLHILPPNHTGPVMQEPGAGPGLRSPIITGGHSMARMAIHDGTLYTDTEPLEWNAVDADRAAALGYGPSDPWPFPETLIIKPIRVDALLEQTAKTTVDAQRRAAEGPLWELRRYFPQYTFNTGPFTVLITNPRTGQHVALTYASLATPNILPRTIENIRATLQ